MLIVGGGIGGLAAALALGREGLDVQVIERSPSFTEIGAGLQLGPNGTRALDDLGILDEAIELGFLPRRLVARNALTGRELTHLDLWGSVRQRYGTPYLVMHRSDLLGLLLRGCQGQPTVRLAPGRDVRTIESLHDRVIARCADGSQYEAAVLVGADGLRSTVRSLVRDDAAVNSGYVAYRGTVPGKDAPVIMSQEEVVVWLGPGMHLVQYPLRPDGSVFNQVAVFRSDDHAAGVADWGSPVELRRRFGVSHPQVQAALTGLMTDRRWEMHDREPLASWSTGRIVLLGDAAHPMLQYLAQGSCQALEDATSLAQCLTANLDVSATGDSVDAAFAAYEEVRKPRVDLVQSTARTWGDVWHVDGLAMALRDEAFRLRAPDDYRHIDWLYAVQRPMAAIPAAQVAGA